MYNPDQPRDEFGKWVGGKEEKDIKSLSGKEVNHYTESGSDNKEKYKNLNDNQKRIVKSFVQLNEHRTINDISRDMNNGVSHEKIKEEYTSERIQNYKDITNYMNLNDKYNGSIERLIRDDRGIYDEYKIGDTMTFDRLTSFGKEGNDFKIRGGNLRIHIEQSTKGTDISNLMPFKEEQEILLPPSKYNIINKTPGHIYLKEL